MGVILATGAAMLLNALTGSENAFSLDGKALLILVLLLVVTSGWKKWKKKVFSPIPLIIIAAVLGGVLY